MNETVAAGQLRAFFERWQRLEEEKQTLADDLKELFAEAKGSGYDTKTMRVVFRDKLKDRAEIDEAATMYDLYWSALDQPKLSLSPARPAHAHVEKIEQFHHSSAPASSPVKTDESPAQPLTAPGNLSPDRATPGEDGPPSKPNPETACAKSDDAANVVIGQSHGRGNSGQAAPIEEDAVPAFLLKDRPPLRPLCLNPTECAGYGTHTCHRCLTAAGRSEEAA